MFNTSELDELFRILISIKGFKLKQPQRSNTTSYLCTSQEERVYGTIKGYVQATQAALSHTRVQSNLMVEKGPPKWPKIKKLSKEQAAEKHTQTKDKEKPL